MSIKKKFFIEISTTCLLFVAVIWMMFQPLMSSYLDGVLGKGPIYVYGISFLYEFGAQGVLVVAFPFLLMLVVVLDIASNRKVWICYFLTFVSLLAYARSLGHARQWLCTEVSWAFQYYVWASIYPVLMIVFAALVVFWIYQNDEEEYAEEEGEVV